MSQFVPKRIFVHHSLTKDSLTVSWNAIRKYHTQTLNWSDIGYHAGVELVASGGEPSFEVLMGRPWDRSGAHVRGQNHDSLGICFVGNYDLSVPRKEMLQAGAVMIVQWMKLFNIQIYDIYTHNQFDKSKSCPGKMFSLVELQFRIQRLREIRHE